MDDALNKLLNDLKKFGIPNIKSLKVESLRPGYGEIVCQLVNELINIELYRRDFEFQFPVHSPDDDEEVQSDELDDVADDQFTGRNEMINGIEIETHPQETPQDLH